MALRLYDGEKLVGASCIICDALVPMTKEEMDRADKEFIYWGMCCERCRSNIDKDLGHPSSPTFSDYRTTNYRKGEGK